MKSFVWRQVSCVFLRGSLGSRIFIFLNDLEGGVFVKKRFRSIAAVLLAYIMVALIFETTTVSAATTNNEPVGATQKAMFIMDTVNISQGMYGSYSHQGSKAIDLAGIDGGKDPAYAPFDGQIVRVSTSAAYIIYQSLNPVEFADGTVDYMTIWVMHDDNVERFYVGQTFSQGQHFFNEGSSGNATGNHIHLECAKGTYEGQYQNDYGWYCIKNQINPYDALYLSESTNIINGYGYNWRRTNGNSEVATPTISFNKSSYVIGETAKISWTASPSDSDFKHYWLVIKNTTSGKQYYGTATGGDGDVSKNSYDLPLTEAGTYKVDVYAVNHAGGGKSDSKTFGVGLYELATPSISFDKDSYIIGETARITWAASPSESDFKHYWLVIKNTTNGKTYYGTATGGDGDVSKNSYDLPLAEAGTYKVDVYTVDHGGGGKSDSKTFSVGKYYLETPTISFDKSSYVIGETAKITWVASPSESNFKHYWLVITNKTSGKKYYGTATGGNGDVSKNHYDLPLTEAGIYKVDVYAVNNAGGGKSDSKTFNVEEYELTTPTISFDKNSYVVGETAKITWEASPVGSDFKHYWLVIKNTTSGKSYYGTATGGDGDISNNYYDLTLTEAGTYKVDVYAVNHDGGGKSDSKTFTVKNYELTTPNISFDKSSYAIGETAKITWNASPSGTEFKHYWLVIKNTTSGKQYHGTATGGDGDVNKNYYDLPLIEAGTYKVDVYAVKHDGSGKSDSKTFNVRNTSFEIGDTNCDGIISISDVTDIQRHLAELIQFNDEQLALADTDGNGVINIADATRLQMYLAEYDVKLG